MNVHSFEHSGPSALFPNAHHTRHGFLHLRLCRSKLELPRLKEMLRVLKGRPEGQPIPCICNSVSSSSGGDQSLSAGWQDKPSAIPLISAALSARLRLICDRPSLIEALLPIAPDPAPWTSSASNHVRKPQRPISGDLRPPEARKD